MVKTEEKDYWNKKEIGERLKWLTVSICAINIMMTIGMIFFLFTTIHSLLYQQ